MSTRGRQSLIGLGQSVVGKAVADAALTVTYQAFFLRLVRHASSHFGLSEDDAFEVVQDAFVIAMTKMKNEGQPGAWLYKTVENLAANLRRKKGRRAWLLSRWSFADAPEQDSEVEGDQT